MRFGGNISMTSRMDRFNTQMQPIRDAIDAAMISGADPESLMEDVRASVGWWEDEIAARADADQ